MIEADYSEALTLLLRYPAPPPPFGPFSFIEDALYLRDHLAIGGGVHIIYKYSKKRPLSPSESSMSSFSENSTFFKKGRRRKQQDRNNSGKTASPNISPVKFFQDQGGVEGIIQEAARGLYSRGEKWGVTKALRSAVQGLQTGSNSPRILTDGSHGTPEEGKLIGDIQSTLTNRIRALEHRNQALAKMLQHAVEDLWIQQVSLHEAQLKSPADAVSLAVAKVQFVQVYLENSSMPFPVEEAISDENRVTKPSSITSSETNRRAETSTRPLPATSESRPDNHSTGNQISTISSHEDVPETPSDGNVSIQIQPTNAESSALQDPGTPIRPGPSPFHRPRASLTHSSFSWMLGEDQRQSSFVSASPFPSEKRTARGKAGFLFGDEKDDGSKHSGKPRSQSDEDRKDETITLEYLQGPLPVDGEFDGKEISS